MISLKRILIVLLTILLAISMTGCGKIKNSKTMKKYIENKYNIEVEVVSYENYDEAEDKHDRYASFVLKEKDRNFTFNASSSFVAVGMDGSTFWHQEHTSDNYYECLTNSLKDEISKLEIEYNLNFSYELGLISDVECNKVVNSEEDLTDVLEAINKLMKLYDLKETPMLQSGISGIYAHSNDEYTAYYFPYTLNGAETCIVDSDEEFRERWNIPEGFDELAVEYINELYSGEGYIVDTMVLPAEMMGNESTKNRIKYRIRDDSREFMCEYIFYYQEYQEDFESGTLKDMSSYMEVGTEYVY